MQAAIEETVGAESLIRVNVTRCHEAVDTTRNWVSIYGDPNGPLVQIEGVERGTTILITLAQAKALASRLKEVTAAPVRPISPELVKQMAERAFKPLESMKAKKRG